MKSIPWVLGIILSALSVVMLIKHAIGVGFVPTLDLMLGYYERTLDFLFGWADPHLQRALATFGHWVGLDLHITPQWKHVLVLVSIYFGARARMEWRAGYTGDKFAAVFLGIWGAVLALVVSVSSSMSAPNSAMLPLVVSIVAFVLFDLGNYIWKALFNWRGSWRLFVEAITHPTDMSLFAICGAVLLAFAPIDWPRFALLAAFAAVLVLYCAWLAFMTTFVRPYKIQFLTFAAVVLAITAFLVTQMDLFSALSRFRDPGLMSVGTLIICIALYNVWLGSAEALRSRKEYLGERNSGWLRFTRNAYTRLGFAILGAFIGAGIYVATNAGLVLLES